MFAQFFVTGQRGLLTVCVTVFCTFAAQAEDYSPDFFDFDGTNSMSLEADPAFNIDRFGTIEFWVQPAFDTLPDYEPILVANIGEKNDNFVIAMTREADAIALVIEDAPIAYAVHDFNDGYAHHVAINFYEDGALIFLNGVLHEEVDLLLPSGSSTGFHIGSAVGGVAPFKGAIGQLRIWGYPIKPEYLIEFAQRPVLSAGTEDHPDAIWLQAYSDFANEDIRIVETVRILEEE